MKKFNCTLSNDDCIFDSCDGFDTALEAIEWGRGKGSSYSIQINYEDPEDYDPTFPNITCKYNSLSIYDYPLNRWVYVTAEQAAKFFD